MLQFHFNPASERSPSESGWFLFGWGNTPCAPQISERCQRASSNAFCSKARQWWFGHSGAGLSCTDGPSGVDAVPGGYLFRPLCHAQKGSLVLSWLLSRAAWCLVSLQASCPSSRQGDRAKGAKGRRVEAFPFAFRKGHLAQGVMPTSQRAELCPWLC